MVAKGAMLEVGQAVGRNSGPTGAAFRPAGYLHTTRFFEAETLGLVVEVRDERWCDVAPLFAFPTAQYAEISNLGGIFDRMHNNLAGGGAASQLMLESAVLDFALALSRALRRIPLVDEVIAAIDGDPSRQWDLVSLALVVGASSEEVSAAMAAPLASFVRARRINVAKRLIVETDEPIAAIAEAAGFYDQAHLTHALVRATGSTPRKLRALRRAR